MQNQVMMDLLPSHRFFNFQLYALLAAYYPKEIRLITQRVWTRCTALCVFGVVS